MQKRNVLSALCAVLFALPGAALALSGAEHKEMLKNSPAYAKADAELNQAWKALRAALKAAGLEGQFDGGLKPPHPDSLLASQRNWLVQRDSDAESLRAGGSEVDGHVAALRKRTAFLRRCTEHLRAFIALPAPKADAPFMRLLKAQGGTLSFDACTGSEGTPAQQCATAGSGSFSSYVEFDADGTARVGTVGRPANMPNRWKLLPDGRVRIAYWEGVEGDYRLHEGRYLDGGGTWYLLDGSGTPNAAEGQGAAPGATLVEVRYAPAVEGKTPVTLKATAPLTLTFHELDYESDGPRLGKVTETKQLAAGETHTFSHVQPFDMPVQGICAQPQQGERKCWLPQDDESDDGGRFIMAPGFVLKK